MPKSEPLPAAIHDHFRKANVLHGYVEKSLGDATKHALETGEELLAAKAAVPHGRWEEECDRLFTASARTARFYMQFAKDFAALPKRHQRAVLMLEGTLKGAAQAAKQAARPTKPKPPEDTEEEDEELVEDVQDADPFLDGTEPEPEETSSRPPGKGKEAPAGDYGKCPNCAGEKWDEDEDGVSCSRCHHPHGEPAGDVDTDRLTLQRSKTVKTAEALMRAFDDLQVMKAKECHTEAVEMCKWQVKTAKRWK